MKFDDGEREIDLTSFSDLHKDINHVREQLKNLNDAINIGLDFDENSPEVLKIVPAILAISLHANCSFTVIRSSKRMDHITHMLDKSLIVRPVKNSNLNGEQTEQKFFYHVHTSGTMSKNGQIISVPMNAFCPNIRDFVSIFQLGRNFRWS